MSKGKVVALATTVIVACVPSQPAQARGHSASAQHRAQVRAELLRQVKKNPRVVRRRSFLRKAALVNFVLPVTIRLRNNNCSPIAGGGQGACAGSPTVGTALNETGTPTAVVDLGPSLGQRTIALGGSLSAEIQFSDSYDGGALGNVNLKLLPSTTKFLSTSSVPLLWNPDTSNPVTRSDANFIKATTAKTGIPASSVQQGCGDFYSNAPGNTAASPPLYNALYHGFSPAGYPSFGTGNGLPGFPVYDPAGTGGTNTPESYIPIYPGVDGLDQLKSDGTVGDNDHLGPSQTPFPGYGPNITPGGFTQPANIQDTVFRTNALQLTIAAPGIAVDQSTGTGANGNPTLSNGPQGSQNIVTGISGGQANLFGNIPGKNVGIDVTVNLSTVINGIARITDEDVFKTPLLSGDDYQAHMYNCHQAWLQAVQNYIPGVRLEGSLRIAPAITKDGKLRIAKAIVQTPTTTNTHVALSVCLQAESAYVDYNDDPFSFGFANRTIAPSMPPRTAAIFPPANPPQFASGLYPVNSDVLPVFADAEKFDPVDPSYKQLGGNGPSDVKCNTAPYELVRRASFTAPITPYATPAAADGYSTSRDGSQVSVAGDIKVNPLNVDVIIGDA